MGAGQRALVALFLATCIGLAGCVVYDPNVGDKVTKDALTRFSTENGGFNGQVFVMAVHEQHPFVFFDCDPEKAKKEWEAAHPGQTHAAEPVASEPIKPPASCKRQEECPGAPDSEPFCGITIEIARDICKILNCTLKIHIASANPNHWESGDQALAAIGAGQTAGQAHWADVAAGALHITEDRALRSHFTTPYYQTGYRLVTRRPGKPIDMWSFFAPFHWSLWILVAAEVTLACMLLYAMEAPALTLAEGGDSDLIEGGATGVADAWYWAFTAFTTYVDKAPRTAAGKLVMAAHGFFMLIILASYTANLASFLTNTAVTPPFTGWDTGATPLVPKSVPTVKLAILGGASGEELLSYEEERLKKKFTKLQKTETWEEAMDSVLCGDAEAAFHDEAMVLYYMNHEMVKFG